MVKHRSVRGTLLTTEKWFKVNVREMLPTTKSVNEDDVINHSKLSRMVRTRGTTEDGINVVIGLVFGDIINHKVLMGTSVSGTLSYRSVDENLGVY